MARYAMAPISEPRITDTTNEIATITHSLEICAERAGDIVPPLFTRFFNNDETARLLMQHSDQHMQGRMFESVLELLMSDEHLGPGNYLEWELENHIDAYAATAAMYETFFDSLVDEVRVTLGAAWTDEIETAWQARIDRIMRQVTNHPRS